MSSYQASRILVLHEPGDQSFALCSMREVNAMVIGIGQQNMMPSYCPTKHRDTFERKLWIK